MTESRPERLEGFFPALLAGGMGVLSSLRMTLHGPRSIFRALQIFGSAR